MSRFLSKDFLAGVMFIAFGLGALYLGRHLAPGTTVRMGPGWVPHMLSYIMLFLGSIISLVLLFITASKREKEVLWVPVGAAAIVFLLGVRFGMTLFWVPPPWIVNLSNDLFLLVSTSGLLALFLLTVLIPVFGWMRTDHEVDLVEAPKWKPITMVTIGIVCFALLLEPSWFPVTGLIPALIALVLIASIGGDEFKIVEVIGNIVVLTILCVIVFKVGLSMNIDVLHGVW